MDNDEAQREREGGGEREMVKGGELMGIEERMGQIHIERERERRGETAG